ncbi:hypothetical protein L5515_009174 [Caenorhabditis briggsae]|uniref:LRAT domain-containing protein n=1 Tax=Caenorhabditis briggsae TaxID=6238 RepID=A0AAE9FC84_CAEBR|nr:hypothetical protein L5515_009174 [Caenorhabditis briggsae]
MEELKHRVAACQSRWNVASTVQVNVYTSCVGQHYAILVTKGVWYKVRLFVEKEYSNCPSVPLHETLVNGERNRIEQDDLTENEHLTLNGVKERIENFHNFFKKPDFKAARKIMDQSGYFDPYFIREVPKDYASNPDRYLKRGDIIATPFVKFAVHTAIYLGNGQVSHLSGHGGGKAAGVAREEKLREWLLPSTPTEQVNFYTSSVGQHYAILVTKGVWYKVRLFVENEYTFVPVPKFYDENILTLSAHLTWNGVQEQIELLKKFFNEPNFDKSRQILQYPRPFFIRDVPEDYASNPDRYLKRGDIIATPFVKVAVHTAIYLGNGQVSHVSGHGGGKAAGVARIGRLLGDFTTKGTEYIWIVFLPLRIRTGEEIAKKAEELAADKFRDGDYNILLRNCQHFVFLCATGVEFAII